MKSTIHALAQWDGLDIQYRADFAERGWPHAWRGRVLVSKAGAPAVRALAYADDVDELVRTMAEMERMARWRG